MSLGLVCDACGETLLLDSGVRYVLRIQGFAAYDPLEITREDLERDLDREIQKTLGYMKDRDPQSLEEEVYKEFQLDLCAVCWKEYRRDPLAGFRPRRPRQDEEEEKEG